MYYEFRTRARPEIGALLWEIIHQHEGEKHECIEIIEKPWGRFLPIGENFLAIAGRSSKSGGSYQYII